MFKCIVSEEGLKVMVVVGQGCIRLYWAEDLTVFGLFIYMCCKGARN